MKKELLQIPQINLIGLSVRTNNKNEQNPETLKIANLVNRYFSDDVASKIPNRENPGITYIVYTDYASNEHGDYTCFIGEEVSTLNKVPLNLAALIIATGKYQKFTTDSGRMPDIVINAWQQIWKLSETDLGGQRNYKTDFEVYDQRAADPHNSIIDIYIGIK